MLRVEHLTKRFGGLIAVNDVTFDVARGQVVSIVGPNGAGKTTLFNLITGIAKPDAGNVTFDGRDITGFEPHLLAQMGIGRTFQNIRLFPHLNALENVMIGRVARTRSGVLDALRCSALDRRERIEMVESAEALLDWVGVGANRFLQIVGRNAAGGIHGQTRDGKTFVIFEIIKRLQHRVVLDSGSDEMLSLRFERARRAEDGEIVRLGSATGENDFTRFCAQKFGRAIACVVEQGARFAADVMDARRIAPKFIKKRQHRRAHVRVERRGGVVIEINRPWHLC